MASRCKRGGADVGIVVVVSRSVLVMHKACFFFFSKRVLAYTKRYNTCVVIVVVVDFGSWVQPTIFIKFGVN